jgi:hypothetical protein
MKDVTEEHAELERIVGATWPEPIKVYSYACTNNADVCPVTLVKIEAYANRPMYLDMKDCPNCGARMELNEVYSGIPQHS